MPALVEKSTVIEGVSRETIWWVSQRMSKLRDELHETMSLNPFLAPILFDLHHAANFADLGELLLASHLMTGHFTGFGKLVDEKVLPQVFNTTKLSGTWRAANNPYAESPFNEIDHIVPRPSGLPALLSLKTSRWTIQLTAAVGLNRSFAEMLGKVPGHAGYPGKFSEIVVGVVVGQGTGLTDKYDILRGINRGKQHSVVDITSQVRVLAGRDFWAWINGDEKATQDWIMDGILAGLKSAACRDKCRDLLVNYKAAFNRRYAKNINSDGSINWHQLLSEVNG